jgi:arylsulfatase A-like enzyme
MARWKGKLPAGGTYAHPVISLDVLPTALAAAGAALPPERRFDGVNLLPYLTGANAAPPHDTLFWRFGRNLAAVRAGAWKLLRQNGETKLFNLDADIGEKNDLAVQQPEKVRELSDRLAAWEKELPPPPVGARQAAKAKKKATEGATQQPKKKRVQKEG